MYLLYKVFYFYQYSSLFTRIVHYTLLTALLNNINSAVGVFNNRYIRECSSRQIKFVSATHKIINRVIDFDLVILKVRITIN